MSERDTKPEKKDAAPARVERRALGERVDVRQVEQKPEKKDAPSSKRVERQG